MSLSGVRDNKGQYHLTIYPVLENFPSDAPNDDVRRVNTRMEQSIMQAPEQYMWLHRRFKTRADENAPSYY